MAVESNTSSTPWYADSSSNAPSASGSTDKPLIQQAKQQTQKVLEQTQQKAGEVMGQARTQVVSQLESQKDRATGSLESVALALRQTGQHLREQNQTALSQYTEQIAESLERFSGSLSQRNMDQMIGEVERFARRQPALFLGTSFALGLLAARFLKSSSPNEGAMAGQSSGAMSPSGSYRVDTQDLAHPVDVTGTTAAAGSMGTASPTASPQAAGPTGTTNTRAGRGSGNRGGASSAATTPSTSALSDADDDTDLVSSRRPNTRGEIKP